MTKGLAIAANKRVAQNKRLATRNNHSSKESLLRGGLARCAYCSSAVHVNRGIKTLVSGEEAVHFNYDCRKPHIKDGKRCHGCSISVDLLDHTAVEKIFKIIHDPSEVDKRYSTNQRQSGYEHRKQALKNLAAIQSEQEALQNNLGKAMRKDILNEKSIRFLNGQLDQLEEREQNARKQLDDEQALQDKYNKLQCEIAAFHQQCREWREQIDDPEFTPSFKFLHDACLYSGINATVWKSDHKPRYEIHTDPPDIVELLS